MASSGGKRIVEADEYVLKDSTGRVRARLGMAEEGPALTLYGESGQPTAMLSSSPGGPGSVRKYPYGAEGGVVYLRAGSCSRKKVAIWKEAPLLCGFQGRRAYGPALDGFP